MRLNRRRKFAFFVQPAGLPPLKSEVDVYRYDPNYPDTPDYDPRFSTLSRTDTPPYDPRFSTLSRTDTPPYDTRFSTLSRTDTPPYDPCFSTLSRTDTPPFDPDITTSNILVLDLLTFDTFVPKIPATNSDTKELSLILDTFADYDDLTEQIKSIEFISNLVVN